MNEKNKNIIMLIISIVIIIALLGGLVSYSKGYLDLSFIINPDSKFGSMITPGPEAFTEEETKANRPSPENPNGTGDVTKEPSEAEEEHETLYGDEGELYENETEEFNFGDPSETEPIYEDAL